MTRLFRVFRPVMTNRPFRMVRLFNVIRLLYDLNGCQQATVDINHLSVDITAGTRR